VAHLAVAIPPGFPPPPTFWNECPLEELDRVWKEGKMPGERERSRVIREALKLEDNRRFLRSLPAFKTAPKLPSEIREKLRRLEAAERNRRRRP
jgi:hypothetical protein